MNFWVNDYLFSYQSFHRSLFASLLARSSSFFMCSTGDCAAGFLDFLASLRLLFVLSKIAAFAEYDDRRRVSTIPQHGRPLRIQMAASSRRAWPAASADKNTRGLDADTRTMDAIGEISRCLDRAHLCLINISQQRRLILAKLSLILQSLDEIFYRIGKFIQ